jgi:fatty-acyl-CoA synthase
MCAIIPTTVGSALRSAAARFGAAPALVAPAVSDGLRRWTFIELLEEAESAARALLERFSPGERLAIWAPNVAECYLAHLACGLAGLAAVPVPTGLTPAELRAVLSRAKAAGIALVASYRGVDMAGAVTAVAAELPCLREVIDLSAWGALVSAVPSAAALPDIDPGSPVQIQFSSGTTGAPKGIVLHHSGVMNASRLLAERAEVGPGDRWLNFMPLSYVAGSAIVAPAALQAGAAQIICDFDPADVLALAEAEAASVVLCGTTMAKMMADQPSAVAGLKTLRTIGLGGSMPPPGLCRRLEAELALTVWVMYGLTETCGAVTQTRPSDTDDARLATVGAPLPGAEVAIIEPGSGRRLEMGDEGEVCVRGYQLMSGYLDDPQATAKTIDTDGWLHTGDLGRLDNTGRLRIAGRLKDIVNRGGRKLYPAEIEQVLSAHPGVGAVAVAPLPDRHWGEIAAAFVKPSSNTPPSDADLVAWCRRHLAPYKTPERWIFVNELPLTRSGKVQKQTLVQAYLKDAPPAAPPLAG